MNDVVRLENLGLVAHGKLLKTIYALFQDINFKQVYRDKNIFVDAFSNESILRTNSLMIVEEFFDGALMSHSEGVVSTL